MAGAIAGRGKIILRIAMDVSDKLAELSERGFCVLKGRFPAPLIDACREAFWPILLDCLKNKQPVFL
jgi:hypothetical protein